MALGENICGKLKLNELKKNSVRKAILLFMLEWKDLDEHLDSTQQYLDECFNEIDSRENHLFSIQESVGESNKELEAIRESIEERIRQFECSEREFKLFQEEHVDYFNSKEKQLNLIRESAEESVREVELREEKLGAQQKLVEGLFEKFELEQKQFEPIKKSMDEKLKEMNSKEKHLENRSKELHSIQDWIERRAKELDVREEQVEARAKELVLKENHLDSAQSLTEERYKELGIKEKQLDSVKHLNEQRSKELDSRERQLDSVKNFHQKCFKEYLSKKKELQSDKKLLEERSKELDSTEKQLQDRFRKLELKEKQYHNDLHLLVKTEQLEDGANNLINCSSADIHILVTMDGKTLQLFLNERSLLHDSMSDEVFRALELSLDPAKLVLDAMEGFYPPHLKKGDTEFEGSVVRSSCILLLEQLRRISPQIQPHVKEAALKLAGQWREKMRAVTENPMEVLGFLHLLASYELAHAFEADELIGLFEVAAEHRQTPELCRLLGFTDCIPDLVEKLIGKKHHLMAVRYICAFGLLDKFPPAPLLKNYLNYLKRISKSVMRGNGSCETKNEAIDNRVDALRDVIRCIVDNKLESEYSPKIIEKGIENILMQKACNKCIASAPHRESEKQQKIEEKHTPPSTASIPTKALTTAPVPPKSMGRVLDTTTAMGVILAHMDGRSLQFFLNEHFEDHDLMRNEVSVALQVSFDSAKLVLDALQGFHPPHPKVGDKDFESNVIRSSCILLLEQLMRLSPHIKPKVKEAATKLAGDWRTKMRADTDNHLAILGFLELIGTYGLASAFDAGELLNIFEEVAQHRHAPELCRALGFSENILSSSILHPQEMIEESSSENLQLNNTMAPSCIDPWHDVNYLETKMYQKGKVNKSTCSEIPTFIHYASDPAKLVFDAFRGCYHSILRKNKNSKYVVRSFIFLLEQLMGASVDIKPFVKEEAMKFAVDWKAKFLESARNPLEVFAFLQFLATYKLASSVNADELLDLLDIVHWREQATDLSRVLGLAHKIPNYIQNLIEKEEWLQAIRYIYAFELVDKFPPVPLLKSHLSRSEALAQKIREEGQYSPKALRLATKKQVAALRSAIKCITRNRLESEYSPESLKTRIEQLEGQKGNWKKHPALTLAPVLRAQLKHQAKKKCPALTLAPALRAQLKQQATKKRPAPAQTTNGQRQWLQAKKRPRYTIPAEADPSAPHFPASYPVHLMHSPPQHLGQFEEESGPYFDRRESMGPPTGRYTPEEVAPSAQLSPASYPVHLMHSPPQHPGQCAEESGPYFDRRERVGPPTGHYTPDEAAPSAPLSPASYSVHLMHSPPQHRGQLVEQCGPYFDRRERVGPPTGHYTPEAAAPSAPLSPASYRVHSMHFPPQHRDQFAEQSGPYVDRREWVGPPTGRYTLGGSIPDMPQTSHPVWQYIPDDAVANESPMPFGIANNHFGVAADLNAGGSMSVGARYLWH